MSSESIRNQNSQERQTQLFHEQEHHDAYVEILRRQNQLDHQREESRHNEYVSVFREQNQLDNQREELRHNEYVSVFREQNRVDNQREVARHDECVGVFREQNRVDNQREEVRREDCLEVLRNPLGAAQRTDLFHSNEQRKEELNNQFNTTLQAERTQHDLRKEELNNQLTTVLQTERTRHEQRKAKLNDQLTAALQIERTRYEQRKARLNDQLTAALQIERTRHEQRKAELNNQSGSRQQTERRAQELTRDILHPILISTGAAASRSRSNNIASTKTIIEQELDKLIALDPKMTNYDFEATLICPISASLMLDPVIVADSGNTYDRKEIEKWFRTSNKDPLTSSIVNKDLVPNNLVRGQILELLQKLRNETAAREEQRKRPRTDDNVAQQRKRHQFG